MLYCGKCLIKIRGNKKCCPLCQGDLTGIPSSSVFPSLKRERISNLSLLKIFTFFYDRAKNRIYFGLVSV